MTILQLQNLSNWELLFSQNLEAQPTASGGYIPIPALDLPVLLDRYLLAVRCYNPDAPPRWFLGARLVQVLQLPSEIQNLIEGPRRNARVNQTSLITFPRLAGDYRLKIEVPYWYERMNVIIWQYTGPEGESLSQLDRIEGKIDLLP